MSVTVPVRRLQAASCAPSSIRSFSLCTASISASPFGMARALRSSALPSATLEASTRRTGSIVASPMKLATKESVG